MSSKKFIIEPAAPEWTSAEREKLLQYSIYDKHPHIPLEKIPYSFSYRFTCNDSDCRGHKLICVDWELGQSYRTWKRTYQEKWEQAIMDKYETQIILDRDTYFYVGTLYQYPNIWIITGLFFPPKVAI